MGVWLSTLMGRLFEAFEKDPIRILMLGLDAAGKTTVLYKLKHNEVVTGVPTIGFNVETVEVCKGVSFNVWDVGGQEILRPLWRHYFQNSCGLVYVVDSTDHPRMDEAADELHSVLNDVDMRGVPVVVLANKQDLPNAMQTAQLVDRLRLDVIRDRPWHVQATCAKTGTGLYEAMDQLADMAKTFQKNRTGRF